MKKKIKVLHVIGSLNVGGAENVAMNYARFIDRTKFQCDYLVFGEEEGTYEKEAIRLGSKVIHSNSPRKGYSNFLKNLKMILRNGKYDIVHTHTLLNNGLILKAASSVKITKRVSHSHSTDSGKKETFFYKIYAFLMKRLIRKYATDFLACGKDAGEYLYGEKLFKEKGVVIHNGIDTQKFIFNENKRSIVRKKLFKNHNLVIGHIGRLSEVKNHLFLLDIFNELQKLNRNTSLLIVGDGVLRLTIERKVKELELEDSVFFLGMRSDIEDILQAIDVFVLPSFFEGFPVTLIEAQASGLPCVISSSITPQVKVTELVTFLSLDESAQVWAEKILDCARTERSDKSEEMREKGFDVYKTLRQLENIYEEAYKV